MRKIVVLICLCATSILVFSQQVDPIDTKLEACLNDPENTSTQGMVFCIMDAYNSWDIRLNAVYNRLITQIPKEDAERLRNAQREWVKLLEFDKQFMREFTEHQQGTIFSITHSMIATELVKSRTLILEMMEKEFCEYEIDY